MKRPLRSTRPITSMLNPQFNYVHSSETNIAATFERIRREQAQQEPKPNVFKWKQK